MKINNSLIFRLDKTFLTKESRVLFRIIVKGIRKEQDMVFIGNLLLLLDSLNFAERYNKFKKFPRDGACYILYGILGSTCCIVRETTPFLKSKIIKIHYLYIFRYFVYICISISFRFLILFS